MMKLPKELTFVADAGHGYLKVPLKVLEAYGLVGKLSGFSFKSKKFGFLEEDCDAPLFLKTIKEAGNEHHYKIVEKYVDGYAACRNYQTF
jgi:hypothetical protein